MLVDSPGPSQGEIEACDRDVSGVRELNGRLRGLHPEVGEHASCGFAFPVVADVAPPQAPGASVLARGETVWASALRLSVLPGRSLHPCFSPVMVDSSGPAQEETRSADSHRAPGEAGVSGAAGAAVAERMAEVSLADRREHVNGAMAFIFDDVFIVSIVSIVSIVFFVSP